LKKYLGAMNSIGPLYLREISTAENKGINAAVLAVQCRMGQIITFGLGFGNNIFI